MQTEQISYYEKIKSDYDEAIIILEELKEGVLENETSN